MSRTILLLSIAVAVASAGCASNPSTTTTSTTTTTTTTPVADEVQTLEFTATQSPGAPSPNSTYAFAGPSTARAGWAHVKLANHTPDGPT